MNIDSHLSFFTFLDVLVSRQVVSSVGLCEGIKIWVSREYSYGEIARMKKVFLGNKGSSFEMSTPPGLVDNNQDLREKFSFY